MENLDEILFQTLKRGFYAFKNSSVSLSPNTPKDDIRYFDNLSFIRTLILDYYSLTLMEKGFVKLVRKLLTVQILLNSCAP